LSFNEIIDHIWKSPHYQNIMDNYLGRRRNLKPELFSEIYIEWSKRPKYIENLFNQSERDFGAYFNMTVKNNVISNTSRFYYNVVKSDVRDFDDNVEDDSEDSIDTKILQEMQLFKINQAMLSANLTWFQRQIFLEYYSEESTYDSMSEKYNLNRSYLYKVVRDVRDRIKNEIK
jgi:DNA-directed RNA polymerase specialized sigma24 family protein